LIRDSAARGDETGDLVSCHDAMVDEGLFHILVPRELGGANGTPRDWFDTVVTIAHAEPSAGWIMAQGPIQTAFIAVAGDPDFAASFFSKRQAVASSSAGQATAERHGDGYLVHNARWAYTSGCQGAAYLGGAVRIISTDGTPESRIVLVPADQATINRTWNTHGLRGTGRHHIDLGDEIIIPAGHSLTWPHLTINRPGTLANAITYSAWTISMSTAAVNLGATRRALEAATASAEHKMHRFDTVPVIVQSPFIRKIADLHGNIELAIAGLRRLLDELWEHAATGAPNAVERARIRLAAACAVETGATAVHEAQLLVGADALHRSHPLERLGRDTQMLRTHVAVNPSTREQLGNVLLDTYQGPPDFI